MAGIGVALIGIISIFGYCFGLVASGESASGDINVFNLGGVLGHIGVAMFIFEGNGVVINIRAETKNQEEYPRILKLSIGTCVIVFSLFAIICYMTYRD